MVSYWWVVSYWGEGITEARAHIRAEGGKEALNMRLGY